MSDYPRASMDGPGVNQARYHGDQVMIPSHVAAIPGCGDVLFHHAVAVNVAAVSSDDGPRRIALMLAQAACQCGCGMRGRGLFLTPDPDGARDIAARLMEFADMMERAADDAAATLLKKVAGK